MPSEHPESREIAAALREINSTLNQLLAAVNGMQGAAAAATAVPHQSPAPGELPFAPNTKVGELLDEFF